MGTFTIEGGIPLKGEIIPQGAKNEALQVICASLLTSEKVLIDNIPNILDVQILINILSRLGVEVNKITENKYSFQAKEVNLDYLFSEDYHHKARQLRGSIMIIGPLLARYKKGYIPSPGGDKIGRRRPDIHFKGFEALGAEFTYDMHNRLYEVTTKRLTGAYMLLEEASVTGTANIIMAAVLAQGTTTIYNAACEPYIQQLCKMLNKMGAKISGIGSNLITIDGVNNLRGTTHVVLPDMIEVGSFIGLAAMTGSEITISKVSIPNLGNIPRAFKRLGIEFQIIGDSIHVPGNQKYEIEIFIDGSILIVDDAPWPGLTPDLLSIILVVATQAKGSVLIHQKMFESRLFFVDKLIDMGAQIILCDPHRATVIGINKEYPLRATTMTSPDIRAGVALLIAALSAEGKSVIHNIEQIDRGYENIDIRLNKLGAKIKRK